jgi:hypothetical protein
MHHASIVLLEEVVLWHRTAASTILQQSTVTTITAVTSALGLMVVDCILGELEAMRVHGLYINAVSNSMEWGGCSFDSEILMAWLRELVCGNFTKAMNYTVVTGYYALFRL